MKTSALGNKQSTDSGEKILSRARCRVVVWDGINPVFYLNSYKRMEYVGPVGPKEAPHFPDLLLVSNDPWSSKRHSCSYPWWLGPQRITRFPIRSPEASTSATTRQVSAVGGKPFLYSLSDSVQMVIPMPRAIVVTSRFLTG